MSDFNLPLLRKAIEWAEAEAAKPGQGEWVQRRYATQINTPEFCGTAYCIAGYVVHLDGDHEIRGYSIDGEPTARLAMELLGIDNDDAWGKEYHEDGLFSPFNSIEEVREYAETIARKYGEEL